MFLSPQGMTSSQYGDNVVFMENCTIRHGSAMPRWPISTGETETAVGSGWANPRWVHEYSRNDDASPVVLHLWVSSDGLLYDGTTVTNLGGAVTQSDFDTLATHGVVTCGPQTPRKFLLSSPYTLATCTFSGDTPGTTFGIVHEFKGRMYYAEGLSESTKFYYTAVNAVDGAITSFDLSEFGGGPIVEIESFTRDGGSGPDDFIVFFCSNDAAFIYQGVDPGDSEDWSLVGKFNVPKPGIKDAVGISERCVLAIPGDILILSNMGLISLRETMSSSDGTYQIASWAAPMNDIFESWLALPINVTYEHMFVRAVPTMGLICVNAVATVPRTPSAAEFDGAMYVYDTITKQWYRWGSYKGAPTRYGNQQDVWLAYDSDTVANGDPDRRAYDFVFADIAPSGHMIVLARNADSIESEVNCQLAKGTGGDAFGTTYPLQCSILWAIQPLEKLTSFTEARIDGALYSGTLTSISLHIGIDGNDLVEQFEVTSGWQFFVHRTIGAQGHAVQVRLDFTYTPIPVISVPIDEREVMDLIPRMEIFGINLLEQQSSGL